MSGTVQPRNSAGPGELRLLEQAVGAEALGHRAGRVAHRSVAQPSDGLDHEARGDLSPAQHHVADADLAVAQMSTDPMVDPLVTAAQQAEPVEPGQLVGEPLIEPPPAGAEQEQRARRIAPLRPRRRSVRAS